MTLLDGINDTEDELYTFDSIMETEDKDDALEALKKIKWKLEDEGILGKEYELCDLIEKELEEAETYEEILDNYGLTLVNFREACLLLAQWKSEGLCWADYDRQKKALEIYKNKIVDSFWVIESNNLEQYNNGENEFLTQEEYDLLKEVLNNGR